MINKYKKIYRLIFLLFISFFTVFLIFLPISFDEFKWKSFWFIWKVNPMYPAFADLYILNSSLETLTLGKNPYIENISDPWKRLFNYPPVWLEISSILKLDNKNSIIYFGLVLNSLFIFSILILFFRKNFSIKIFFLLLPLFFSSSFLKGLERGQTDLLIVSVTFLTLIYVKRKNFISFIFLCLSILKLYPIIVIVFEIFKKGDKYLYFLLIIFISYLLLINDEIILILKNTPISDINSFGFQSLNKSLNETGISFYFNFYHLNFLSIIFFIVFILFSFLKLFSKNFLVSSKSGSKLSIEEKQLFLISSLIFISLFILLSNYDYRLLFLFGAIPYYISLGNKKKFFLFYLLFFLSLNYGLSSLFELSFNPPNFSGELSNLNSNIINKFIAYDSINLNLSHLSKYALFLFVLNDFLDESKQIIFRKIKLFF
tara:strand:- start:296 stop:1585 length:1290 start_codon:yes stop_codon:yes gene_type:complete